MLGLKEFSLTRDHGCEICTARLARTLHVVA